MSTNTGCKARQEHYEIARRIAGTDIANNQISDVILAEITRLGWQWTGDSQVVTDPQGGRHYISAEGGFVAQLVQVWKLHQDYLVQGWL